MQQALNGALPVARILADLEQLAGERKLLLVHAGRSANVGAECEHAGGNVGATATERVQLAGELVVRLPQRFERDSVLCQLVLDPCVVVLRPLALLDQRSSIRRERVRIGCRQEAGRPRELRVALSPLAALLPLELLPLDLDPNPLDPIATVGGDGALELVALRAEIGKLLVLRIDLRRQSLEFTFEVGEARAEQTGPEVAEPGGERVPAFAQLFDLSGELSVPLAVVDEWREARDLGLRLQHRFVG